MSKTQPDMQMRANIVGSPYHRKPHRWAPSCEKNVCMPLASETQYKCDRCGNYAHERPCEVCTALGSNGITKSLIDSALKASDCADELAAALDRMEKP